MFLNRNNKFTIAAILCIVAGYQPAAFSVGKVAELNAVVQDRQQVFQLAQASEEPFVEDFDFWVDQCLLLSQGSEPEKTIETCEQAIMLKPKKDNIDIWVARSKALFDLGKYPEAIASFNRVLKVAPEDSISLAYQCAAYKQMGRDRDAVGICETALRTNGSWGDSAPAFAWHQRGLALQEMGRLETAFNSYRRAVENQPENAIYAASFCALAIEVGKLSDCSLSHAISAYERAIALQPKNADLWLHQGLALEQLGHYERALTSYEQAVTLNPEHSFALAHQCSVLNHLEDYEAAKEACEAALKGNHQWRRAGSAYGWVQQSRALIGLKEYEAAIAAANRAIDINRQYAAGYSNRAVALWFLAQSVEQKLLVRSETDKDARAEDMTQARVLYKEAAQSIAKARELYGSARALLKENFERAYPEAPLFLYSGEVLAAFNQGRILTSLGDLIGDQKAKQYQEAILAYEAARRLIQCVRQQEAQQRGLTVCAELDLTLTSEAARNSQLNNADPTQAALTQLAINYLRAISQDGKIPISLAVPMSLEEYEEAIQFYLDDYTVAALENELDTEPSIKTYRAKPPILPNLVATSFAPGEGQAEFLRLSNWATILTHQAVTYWKGDNLTQAKKISTEAAKADPSLFIAQYNEGFISLEVGAYQKALEAFTRAHKLAPGNTYVFTGLGIARQNLCIKQFGVDNLAFSTCRQEAQSYLEQALNLSPGYPLAEACLAKLFVPNPPNHPRGACKLMLSPPSSPKET